MRPWNEELADLCDAVIDDRLTPEQLARLEALVLAEPEAKRFYVEYLHQHGCLHWSAAQAAPATLSRSPAGVRRSPW
jgi:hypothetical protein